MDKYKTRALEILEASKEDLSKKSDKDLEDFIKAHHGGGVPTYGKGAAVRRHAAELKKRKTVKEEELTELHGNGSLDKIHSHHAKRAAKIIMKRAKRSLVGKPEA